MTNPILDALVLYSAAGFILYRAYASKDFSRSVPAILILIFALSAWPFFVPMWICLIAVYAAALLFVPVLKFKGLLKKGSVIWTYSVLALAGLVYLLIKLLVPHM